jgi:hypothetical protein
MLASGQGTIHYLSRYTFRQLVGSSLVHPDKKNCWLRGRQSFNLFIHLDKFANSIHPSKEKTAGLGAGIHFFIEINLLTTICFVIRSSIGQGRPMGLILAQSYASDV